MKVWAFLILVIGVTEAKLGNRVPMDEPQPPTPPLTTVSELSHPLENVTVPACSTHPDVRNIKTRNGKINPIYRWKGQFNVYLDPAFDEIERRNMNNVLWDIWQLIPCVRVGIWGPGTTPRGDYVHIIKGTNNGCSAYVGRKGGRQTMNLQSPGATMHEMIHALGFHHEQSRPDRDRYVTIHWENIEPEFQQNFAKYSTSQVTTFGVPYNVQSIMHYNGYGFSKNGQPTITAKTGEPVGSYVLQETDIQKLKLMYGC